MKTSFGRSLYWSFMISRFEAIKHFLSTICLRRLHCYDKSVKTRFWITLRDLSAKGWTGSTWSAAKRLKRFICNQLFSQMQGEAKKETREDKLQWINFHNSQARRFLQQCNFPFNWKEKGTKKSSELHESLLISWKKWKQTFNSCCWLIMKLNPQNEKGLFHTFFSRVFFLASGSS